VNDVPDDLAVYLGRLTARLHGPPDHLQRLLDETEAHLADAVDHLVAAGTDPLIAPTEALRRFGDVDVVARSMNRATLGRYRRPAAREAATTLTAVAAAGLLAMGVVGLLARVATALTSTSFVFGLPAGARMPAASCRHWLAVQPAATGCRDAATFEASADLTLGLAVAGVVGLLLALLAVVLHSRARTRPGLMPIGAGPALAVVAFGLGALTTALLAAADAVVFSIWGAGLFWVAAATCTLAALASGVLLVRARPLRRGDAAAIR
jgi:preprotein translocase subunit Sss1